LSISTAQVKELAAACGFELAGIAPALPSDDFVRFKDWRAAGMAGEMKYLDDRRGDLRSDPRHLLPSAKTIVCAGKLYNTTQPLSTECEMGERGWISRYAWGRDYHDELRARLEALLERIRAEHGQPLEARVCVDTAPLLERSYARLAGLGWIGKNTCLINQSKGSWFFLGEILLSIPLAPDTPAPARCGSCTRCIDACPTDAIIPNADGSWSLDSRLCISYLTIEKRGPLDEAISDKTGNHLFGCDICQDVCPWNRRAPVTQEEAFLPRAFAPLLGTLAEWTEEDFRTAFRHTPVWRSKYAGFLRNVAFAMGNSARPEMLAPLARLAQHTDELVAASAQQALARLRRTVFA
jgi:epoxyqueuosine reductase